MITMPSLPKLARRNIIVFASCFGALLLFAGIALLPNVGKLRRQSLSIEQLQAQLVEQNDLNSLYRQLEAKRAGLHQLATEPPVQPKPLPAGEISRIVLTLQELAAQEGVVVDNVRPAIESGSVPSHQIRIQAIMHGRLEQHRALLFDILREPYVEELEQLTIETNGKDLTLQMILAINIA